LQGEVALNQQILQACKELIDILSRARPILTARQFKQLVAYAAERMREQIPFELQEKLMAHR